MADRLDELTNVAPPVEPVPTPDPEPLGTIIQGDLIVDLSDVAEKYAGLAGRFRVAPGTTILSTVERAGRMVGVAKNYLPNKTAPVPLAEHELSQGEVLPLRLEAGDSATIFVRRTDQEIATAEQADDRSHLWDVLTIHCTEWMTELAPSYVTGETVNIDATVMAHFLVQIPELDLPVDECRRALQLGYHFETTGGWTARFGHPVRQMPDYGRAICRRISDAAMALMCRGLNQSELMVGLKRLLQIGWDNYTCLDVSRHGRPEKLFKFSANGGHGNGRLFTQLLVNSLILPANREVPIDSFSETVQSYVRNGEPDWRFSKTIRPVRGVEPGGQWYHEDKYRTQCVPAWMGACYAAVRMGLVPTEARHWVDTSVDYLEWRRDEHGSTDLANDICSDWIGQIGLETFMGVMR